jgi:hypothetical protein
MTPVSTTGRAADPITQRSASAIARCQAITESAHGLDHDLVVASYGVCRKGHARRARLDETPPGPRHLETGAGELTLTKRNKSTVDNLGRRSPMIARRAARLGNTMAQRTRRVGSSCRSAGAACYQFVASAAPDPSSGAKGMAVSE